MSAGLSLRTRCGVKGEKSIGLLVKNADLTCAMPLVTVPQAPLVVPLSQHQAQVPCDGDAPVAAEQ